MPAIAPAPAPAPGDRQPARTWSLLALGLLALAPLGPLLAELVPPCPLKTLTGIPCPFCGTTRAALALARLEPLQALRHYPLPTVAWVLFLAGGLVAGALALTGRTLPSPPRPWPRWLKATLLLALLGNWLFNIATGV